MAAARLRFLFLPVLVALVAGALAFTLANHVYASDAGPGIQPSLQGPQQVSPPDDVSGPDSTGDFFPCPTTVPGGGVDAPDQPSPPDDLSPPDGTTGGGLSPPDSETPSGTSATPTPIVAACPLPSTGGLPETGTGVSDNNPYAIAIIFALGAAFLVLIGLAAYATARDSR